MSATATDQESARYRPEAIANYFLKKAEEEGSVITPMKLQKLVYYAQGWSLGLGRGDLIDETVEAWDWGPVVRSLYNQVKVFGRSPVSGPIPVNSRGESRGSVGEEETEELLDAIWENYGSCGPFELSDMTHMPGTPWDQVYQDYDGNIPRGKDVDSQIIEDYFSELLNGSDTSA